MSAFRSVEYIQRDYSPSFDLPPVRPRMSRALRRSAVNEASQCLAHLNANLWRSLTSAAPSSPPPHTRAYPAPNRIASHRPPDLKARRSLPHLHSPSRIGQRAIERERREETLWWWGGSKTPEPRNGIKVVLDRSCPQPIAYRLVLSDGRRDGSEVGVGL